MGLNTAPGPPDRSLGQLFGDLSSQASRLIHDEVELAKIEMTEKAQSLSIVGAYVAAAVGALLFLGTLTAVLTLLLATVVDAWVAAAIVAAAWLVIAARSERTGVTR